jgi:hypothetical protein
MIPPSNPAENCPSNLPFPGLEWDPKVAGFFVSKKVKGGWYCPNFQWFVLWDQDSLCLSSTSILRRTWTGKVGPQNLEVLLGALASHATRLGGWPLLDPQFRPLWDRLLPAPVQAKVDGDLEHAAEYAAHHLQAARRDLEEAYEREQEKAHQQYCEQQRAEFILELEAILEEVMATVSEGRVCDPEPFPSWEDPDEIEVGLDRIFLLESEEQAHQLEAQAQKMLDALQRKDLHLGAHVEDENDVEVDVWDEDGRMRTLVAPRKNGPKRWTLCLNASPWSP